MGNFVYVCLGVCYFLQNGCFYFSSCHNCMDNNNYYNHYYGIVHSDLVFFIHIYYYSFAYCYTVTSPYDAVIGNWHVSCRQIDTFANASVRSNAQRRWRSRAHRLLHQESATLHGCRAETNTPHCNEQERAWHWHWLEKIVEWLATRQEIRLGQVTRIAAQPHCDKHLSQDRR